MNVEATAKRTANIFFMIPEITIAQVIIPLHAVSFILQNMKLGWKVFIHLLNSKCMTNLYYLNVTIHHNCYLTWCILGFFGQNTLTPIGTCTSWNGKDCTDDDTVDVGDGPGSCNSDMDCPCCAPFCSSIGKHCQKTIMWTKRIKVIRWAFYLLSLNVI